MSDIESEAFRCTACGHATNKEKVAVTLWFGSQLTVVEGVPADVCPNCRARHYDAEAEQRLNSLMAAGFPDWKVTRVIETPVFAYADITDFAKGAPRSVRFEAQQDSRDFDRPDPRQHNT